MEFGCVIFFLSVFCFIFFLLSFSFFFFIFWDFCWRRLFLTWFSFSFVLFFTKLWVIKDLVQEAKTSKKKCGK